MNRISFSQATTLFLGTAFLFASLVQCRKTGDLIKDLDRSYQGTTDSSIFATYYSNNTITPSDATPDVNDVLKFRGV